MFCVMGVQVEVVTLIIVAHTSVLCDGRTGRVNYSKKFALTKCSTWCVQIDLVTLIILTLTKCSLWWVTGRGNHTINSCHYYMFCEVGVQVEVVTQIIHALTKCSL